MRQELIKEAFEQRSNFDLNAHNKQGKTVLDLAVRHDDQEFAHYLLSHGANLELASHGAASKDMRILLTSWRRKNLLYAHFNEKNRHGWTPRDRALYEGRHEEVRARLAYPLKKHGMNAVWEEAMNDGEKSILRALLVIGTPDELSKLTRHKPFLLGKWLDKLRDDPGLYAVLKEFPYQSAKRGEPKDFNGEAKFTGTSKEIVCRYLSSYLLEQQALHPQIKFNYNKFGSPEAIANNVKSSIENTLQTLRAQASETYLIDNRRFGQFLVRQFEAMEKEGRKNKLMLIQSTNHAMGLGLRIKEKNGKTSCVVKFFDPNDTTTSTRSKANSTQTFETQTLGSYLSNADLINQYYPAHVGISSMIFVWPEKKENASTSITHGLRVDRTLTSMDIEKIDASVVFHLMKNGFAGNLRQLHGEFNALPENQLIELWAAKHPDGFPALYVGMKNGHAEAVKAYGEGLKQSESIPQDRLIELWAAKSAKGTPALFMGMRNGHAEAVKVYGEWLKQSESLPQNRLIELWAAKNSYGIPALYVGMQNGHAEAVKVYGEWLKQSESIPQDRLIELWAAKSSNGFPALYIAMQEGNAEAVKAYGDAVKLLPPDKQADLLYASSPRRFFFLFAETSSLQNALNRKHFTAAHELIQLLKQLAPKLSSEKRDELRKKVGGIYNPSADHQEWREMNESLRELKVALGG